MSPQEDHQEQYAISQTRRSVLHRSGAFGVWIQEPSQPSSCTHRLMMSTSSNKKIRPRLQQARADAYALMARLRISRSNGSDMRTSNNLCQMTANARGPQWSHLEGGFLLLSLLLLLGEGNDVGDGSSIFSPYRQSDGYLS